MMDIIVFSLMGLGILFSLIVLIKGPNLGDRVVSLDTINIIVIGVISVLATIFENAMYLDVALIYAALAFLETIVFAKYLEGKKDGNS